jgi:hypothetical protein
VSAAADGGEVATEGVHRTFVAETPSMRSRDSDHVGNLGETHAQRHEPVHGDQAVQATVESRICSDLAEEFSVSGERITVPLQVALSLVPGSFQLFFGGLPTAEPFGGPRKSEEVKNPSTKLPG